MSCMSDIVSFDLLRDDSDNFVTCSQNSNEMLLGLTEAVTGKR